MNRVRKYKEEPKIDEEYNKWIFLKKKKKKLERINSRLNDTEKWTSKLEDKSSGTEAEQQWQKKIKRNENSLRDLWDNIKDIDIHITGIPEERERRAQNLSEDW